MDIVVRTSRRIRGGTSIEQLACRQAPPALVVPVQPSASDDDLNYKEVRGLMRGLAVLRALNRLPGGSASTSALARTCGIHRTTAKRLLETLRSEGLVRLGGRSGEYHLTRHVRQLSDGYRHDDWIDDIAAPIMQDTVRDLLWPCDLATVEGGCMVVQESTHRFSMLSQHHDMVGEKIPLLPSALGRAWLAACSDAERDALLLYLDRQAELLGLAPVDRAVVLRTIAETRERGFAINTGDWTREARFSAVAVPVVSAGGVIAALNLVFPRDAVSIDDMAKRYVPGLKAMATRIGVQVALATLRPARAERATDLNALAGGYPPFRSAA